MSNSYVEPLNYKYIAFSMREGIEELEKIAALADTATLTEDEFKARLYATLLDIFRGFNLRKAAMTKEEFEASTTLPKEIMELFE